MDEKLRAYLVNGSEEVIEGKVVDLEFSLQGHSSSQQFWVMKMGQFQRILGMDWLKRNNAVIHCESGTISLQTKEGKIVQIQGTAGKAPLRVVKAAKLVKGLRKGSAHFFFVIKLNDPEKTSEGQEPEWLSEYQDVVPEELTDLPPSRGPEHEKE